MAVVQNRNMRAELEQGIRDAKYMHLTPDWGGAPLTNVPVERLQWPTYARVERHDECDCYEPITPREPRPSVNGMYTVPEHNPALRF